MLEQSRNFPSVLNNRENTGVTGQQIKPEHNLTECK